MTPFEAVNHAFSVCASGGFSTRATSIAAFDSRWIEAVSMFFMLLTSLHFGMIYLVFATRSLKPLKSPVLKFYLLSLLVFILVMTCLLRVDGCAESWGKSLWISTFQIISTASTTGFSLTDNAHWPVTAGIVMLFAGLMCGCAGSTSGGVKADRVLVFFKSVQHRVLQVVHPSSVTDVKLGEHVVKQEELSAQMLYLTLYCLMVALSVFISLLLGVDSLNSFAASVMSMGNVGPALGDLGNMGSFNSISAGAKFLYSMDMFFGRIEIYPVLAVLAMIFSRKAK